MDLKETGTKAKKWGIRLAVGAVLLLVAGSGLYTCATLNYSYSKGERVGFVQKISQKGWLCKTNEGDLAMVNVAGQQAEIFKFTVRDDAVFKKIESFAGHKVALQYEEHRGVPSSCFGDTSYFVVDVSKAD
ncbi:MAG: hypothetical protein ABSE49_33415 [Polyangiaceae bacterium]|jgi:hypothetical protein